MVTAALAFVAAASGAMGVLLVLPAGAPRGASRAAGSGGEGTRGSGMRGSGMRGSGIRREGSRGGRARRGGSRGVRLLAALGNRVRPGRAPADLRGRIEAAGRPAGLGVREVMAAKVAAALLGGVAAVPLAALAPGRLGLVIAPLAPAGSFLLPDLWLGRLAADRARRVRRDLPALLDILRVTIGAGGSLAWALGAVGERADGPLAAEWGAVAREVSLGVPLAHALDGLAARLPQPEIRAFVAALDRAARHGAPLSATLEAQARAARFALSRRIREDAARAGPKIQLVVALLLVPSVLLLVAAALASALLDGSADALPL
jgi:tight adherence protein C